MGSDSSGDETESETESEPTGETEGETDSQEAYHLPLSMLSIPFTPTPLVPELVNNYPHFWFQQIQYADHNPNDVKPVLMFWDSTGPNPVGYRTHPLPPDYETWRQFELTYPSNTRLRYESDLKVVFASQTFAIRAFVKAMIPRIILDPEVFEKAFVDGEKTSALADFFLVNSKDRFIFRSIHQRLRNDYAFTQEIIELVSLYPRSSNLH